eukprot:GHVS01053502.1.p1 GENE.GHVS01053502.1~~GHVS01053502.1.p1  ORF type:complete len:590 (+),score=49.58 GHVS01053502.1:279-2048(+)
MMAFSRLLFVCGSVVALSIAGAECFAKGGEKRERLGIAERMAGIDLSEMQLGNLPNIQIPELPSNVGGLAALENMKRGSYLRRARIGKLKLNIGKGDIGVDGLQGKLEGKMFGLRSKLGGRISGLRGKLDGKLGGLQIERLQGWTTKRLGGRKFGELGRIGHGFRGALKGRFSNMGGSRLNGKLTGLVGGNRLGGGLLQRGGKRFGNGNLSRVLDSKKQILQTLRGPKKLGLKSRVEHVGLSTEGRRLIELNNIGSGRLLDRRSRVAGGSLGLRNRVKLASMKLGGRMGRFGKLGSKKYRGSVGEVLGIKKRLSGGISDRLGGIEGRKGRLNLGSIGNVAKRLGLAKKTLRLGKLGSRTNRLDIGNLRNRKNILALGNLGKSKTRLGHGLLGKRNGGFEKFGSRINFETKHEDSFGEGELPSVRRLMGEEAIGYATTGNKLVSVNSGSLEKILPKWPKGLRGKKHSNTSMKFGKLAKLKFGRKGGKIFRGKLGNFAKLRVGRIGGLTAALKKVKLGGRFHKRGNLNSLRLKGLNLKFAPKLRGHRKGLFKTKSGSVDEKPGYVGMPTKTRDGEIPYIRYHGPTSNGASV